MFKILMCNVCDFIVREYNGINIGSKGRVGREVEWYRDFRIGCGIIYLEIIV